MDAICQPDDVLLPANHTGKKKGACHGSTPTHGSIKIQKVSCVPQTEQHVVVKLQK